MPTESATDRHRVNAGTLERVLSHMAQAKLPAFLWGPPGVGKSAITRSVADALEMQFIDIRAIHFDPVDLHGIPVPDMDANVTRWLTPAIWPRDGEGIILLDELPAAPPMMQAAFYQLVLDRRIGEYQLPDGWAVFGAGNRETDRAVSHRMPSALANRFTHFELMVDKDEFYRWGATHDLADEVMGFLRFKPTLLHVFDPASNAKRFPSPRSWERVSDIVKLQIGGAEEHAMIAGTIGDAAAIEFVGFLAMCRRLPAFETIVDDPENAPVPADDPATLYAIGAMLAQHVTRKTIGAVLRYAKRMPRINTVSTMVDCVRRHSELQETKAFVEFAADFSDLVI